MYVCNVRRYVCMYVYVCMYGVRSRTRRTGLQLYAKDSLMLALSTYKATTHQVHSLHQCLANQIRAIA